ncbi:MAG: efflux RND transporter periplasmic adaptor subunit [Sinobacteraceae bacterium]|nr:efflux RND transporter periplasmic adaptor subunit [Nevskiaceae bacterium]
MNSLDFRRAASITAPLGTGLAAALWLSACHSRPTVSAPPAVVVARPVHPDGASGGGAAIRYPVEVAARYSNPMSFRVPGKLIERDVRIGDSVKQGQVVARLDPTDAQKQAASARAALQAAEHRLLFAKQQLDRDSAQAAQNLIATNQLEQTQDAFIAAEAAREEAAAQLAVARNNLEYNTLAADHDGVITSENVDTGQVVAAGQAVYGLAWSGAVDVTLDAANSNLGEIGIGQTASVTFPALPGRSFEARVREVAPLADPQSRTYRVKLTLAQSDPTVRLGMTGDALLLPMISRAEAPRATYTVPSTALFHEGNSPAVFVVSPGNSTLELRPVTVTRYSDHSSLVTSGLRDGDTVVLAGVHAVYPGERVTAVRPLFDSEGDVAGPAPSQSAQGSGRAGVGP